MGPPFSSGNDYWPVNFYWTTHDSRLLEQISGLPGASALQNRQWIYPGLARGGRVTRSEA
jgi:hypothetical protein